MAKGPEAFRTISEAADELNVPQHVLRFWETKFSFIRPMKRAGGRRFYRPHDIAVLRGVRKLLHDDGLTIKGVQRLHREEGVRRLVEAGTGVAASPAPATTPMAPIPALSLPISPAALTEAARKRLAGALSELEIAKRRLDVLLQRG